MPPLPSLEVFPEEGDKEVDSEHEREKISFRKAVVPCLGSLKKEKKRRREKKENKLFQSSPRDRRKTGDVLLPLWLLWRYS